MSETRSHTEKLAAFGSWRCNCTALEATMEAIPDHCPEHNEPLLGPRSWEPHLCAAPFGRMKDHRTDENRSPT